MRLKILAVLVGTALPGVAAAQDDVSIERGLHISIIAAATTVTRKATTRRTGRSTPARP